MAPIIGPVGDGYKLAGSVEPRLELLAVESQDVRAETTAAGQLAASVPAENRLDGETETLGDLASSEEALALGIGVRTQRSPFRAQYAFSHSGASSGRFGTFTSTAASEGTRLETRFDAKSTASSRARRGSGWLCP